MKRPTTEEVVAMLSKPELQTMLSDRGNAVVDVILEALYERINREEMPVRICPKCSGETIVIESRGTADELMRRRRKCVDCGYRFSTVETFFMWRK